MSQRALHVVHYWGGCPQVRTSKWQRFHRLISRCAAEGLANTLVLSRIPEAHLVDPFRDVGCSVIAQPRPRWSIDLPAIRRTTRLLKSLEADVLHCHNVHTSPLLVRPWRAPRCASGPSWPCRRTTSKGFSRAGGGG